MVGVLIKKAEVGNKRLSPEQSQSGRSTDACNTEMHYRGWETKELLISGVVFLHRGVAFVWTLMHVQTAVYSVYTVHIAPHWIAQELEGTVGLTLAQPAFYTKTEHIIGEKMLLRMEIAFI